MQIYARIFWVLSIEGIRSSLANIENLLLYLADAIPRFFFFGALNQST